MPEQGNPIDTWGAIQKMRKEVGWQLFLERYSMKGNVYVSQLFDTELSDNGVKYTKRDLIAHQLETLKTVQDVLNEFETEAKNELERQKHPSQKGI